MVATIDDAKRTAIGQKLADMKAVQQQLIANEEKLSSAVTDSDIRQRLQDMIDDDRKNMGVLETVIVEYGIQAEPSDKIQQILKKSQELMQGNEFSLYDKFAEHELLKHSQVMCGLLVHKAGQVVGADIEVAITPLNTVNYENRSHQELLKGILEIIGTRELTGQEPDQGLWGRVQDAVAALSGVVGSAVSRTKDDMNIVELIQTEHRKVDTLFMEIEQAKDPQKIQEFFGQLYKDLSAHAEAEQEVVYPALRNFYPETQELYDEHSEVKQMLEQMKSMNPGTSEFKSQVEQLKKAVQDHVREEENDALPKLRQNMSEQQMEQISSQFKEAKSRFQKSMAS
ncbi:MAG TPA: DNA nickase [Cyanobacteria bacterium UBA8803]|nr:DNA nickase [Cyanobacteria bacterium UBA9273]HBL59650.1 DNA nickase [Cyanobacteria bacterium UBA8803]